MYPNLEKYLEEISHYLVLKQGTEDVLAEIRSHILEKAGQEYGDVSEENLAKVIDGYGNPRDVAERYLEGESLIAPTLRKYLIRYTGFVFVIHMTLTLLALLLKTRIIVFPFLYIPRLSGAADLFYLPTALVYDLGLVGIFLYFVSQRKEMTLPWFNIHFDQPARPELETSRPRVHFLVLMLTGFAVVAGLYIRFQTLFVFGVGPDGPQSLFRPAVSHWYSLAVLALIAVGIGGYALQFYFRREWVEVAQNAASLLIAGIVNIYPLESEPTRIPFLSERTLGTAFVLLVAVTSAFGLLKSLFRITRLYLSDARQRGAGY
jgi:hypothetical protein